MQDLRMELLGKTILIMGGSAGMGLQFAKLLSEKGNNVIITGRDEERLKEALHQLEYGSYEIADETRAEDVRRLYKIIQKKYDGLHLLINNAGKGYVYELVTAEDPFARAKQEMMANYLSVIRMVDQFLPLLMRVPEAAIVNVSSMAAIVPVHYIPTYSASKAALHSYTQLLRQALAKKTRIKVFELIPLLVDAEFSRHLNGITGMTAVEAAKALIRGLEADEYEIRIGPGK